MGVWGLAWSGAFAVGPPVGTLLFYRVGPEAVWAACGTGMALVAAAYPALTGALGRRGALATG
jgi:hypothetical protein